MLAMAKRMKRPNICPLSFGQQTTKDKLILHSCTTHNWKIQFYRGLINNETKWQKKNFRRRRRRGLILQWLLAANERYLGMTIEEDKCRDKLIVQELFPCLKHERTHYCDCPRLLYLKTQEKHKLERDRMQHKPAEVRKNLQCCWPWRYDLKCKSWASCIGDLKPHPSW